MLTPELARIVRAPGGLTAGANLLSPTCSVVRGATALIRIKSMRQWVLGASGTRSKGLDVTAMRGEPAGSVGKKCFSAPIRVKYTTKPYTRMRPNVRLYASWTATRRIAYRASGRYLIRCGSVASAPSRRRLSSSYAWKLPSNHSTWLSPSNARMWVARRSRNQRSWLMITAQPANSSSASSSARSVSTSRSFVGSSSRSTLCSTFSIFARCTRLRSPPDRMPTFFC